MIFSLFRKSRATPSVERVYAEIVAASRAPELFLKAGVPDTVMGRFESLVLHMSLVLRRLKALPPPADLLSQELVDRFFADLDASLREIGIGDVSVPKKVKKLGQAALAHNVLEMPDQPGLAAALARRVRAQSRLLEGADFDAFLDGSAFGARLEASHD
jgi:cytochrome b pre-mRNA-processing protein 3